MALVRNSVLRAGSVIETSLYSDDAIGPGIRNLFVMLMRLPIVWLIREQFRHHVSIVKFALDPCRPLERPLDFETSMPAKRNRGGNCRDDGQSHAVGLRSARPLNGALPKRSSDSATAVGRVHAEVELDDSPLAG